MEAGIMKADLGRHDHRKEQIAFGRLLWVGPLAAVIAAVGTVLVRTVAVVAFGVPPNFQALTLSSVLVSSVVGALGATVVFAIVGRFARRPVRLFRVIAIVVLLLSFLSPVLALPGAGLNIILTLEATHVVVAAVSVALLTTLARKK